MSRIVPGLARVLGYITPLNGPGCLWQPSTTCQLERSALSQLFEGVEVMRVQGEAVLLETSERAYYRVLNVDGAQQRLRLIALRG